MTELCHRSKISDPSRNVGNKCTKITEVERKCKGNHMLDVSPTTAENLTLGKSNILREVKMTEMNLGFRLKGLSLQCYIQLQLEGGR